MRLANEKFRAVARCLTVFLAALFAGCASVPPETAAPVAVSASRFTETPNLKIVVSIPPQKDLVQRLAGEHAEVISLMSANDDFTDANFQPAGTLAAAQLYFRFGAPFEKKLAAPDGCKVYSMLKGVKLTPLARHVESLLPETGKFGGPDYYIWLSPSRMVRMLTVVYQALREADPDHIDDYTLNYTRLTRDLNSLEGDIQRVLLDRLSSEVLVYQPVLGYFCEDFGLTQFSADVTSAPDLARAAIEKKIRAVLLTNSIGEVGAQLPQLLNGTVARVNPLSGDYFGNLRQIAAAIAGRSGE
ncbi:MAG: zinc ABC transporter substrate-binding protein [Planctomycetota bacterium]|jgi:zinc transport system substrate-binding protein|nr:zinc ABC transporter substrate-binding protein [Planctomycetota bacterium]